MGLTEFLSIVGRYHSLVRDSLAELLTQQGDVHYKTAIVFLEQSKTSNDSEGDIRSAITTLETAYQVWYTVASDKSPKAKLKRIAPTIDTLLGSDPSQHVHVKACRKAFECAVLLAVVYNAKGDVNPTRRCVKNARECFQLYHEAYILQTRKLFLCAVNPHPFVAASRYAMATHAMEDVKKTLAVEFLALEKTCNNLAGPKALG